MSDLTEGRAVSEFPFGGEIEDVRIYDRMLTAEEIAIRSRKMSEYTPQTLDELADYSKFDEAPRPSILYAHARAWAEDKARLETIRVFENQPTQHMLRIIADDLDNQDTHTGVMRARAGWLRRFAKALAATQEEGE